jgi:hypothetical protein
MGKLAMAGGTRYVTHIRGVCKEKPPWGATIEATGAKY